MQPQQAMGPAGASPPDGSSLRITDIHVLFGGTDIGSFSIVAEDTGFENCDCALRDGLLSGLKGGRAA